MVTSVCWQTTSSLYTGQTVIEMVQDTIVAAMITGEEEVIETPRLQMEVSMMRGDELNGTVQSASIDLSAGVRLWPRGSGSRPMCLALRSAASGVGRVVPDSLR